MRMTGSQGRWPWAASANMAPRTHDLVGQRVEEGARAGGAVAAGHVAIEPVAAGEDDADHDVDPRGAPHHEHHDETGAARRRATVTALAGVTSALGPKVNPGWPGGRGGRGARGWRRSHELPVAARAGRGGRARRAGDDHVDEAADREVGREVHDAVDLGRLVHGAAPPRRVDEHAAHLADQPVPLGRGDGVLQLGALAQALEGQLGGDLVSSPAACVPVLVGEGEEPGPVELGLVQELRAAGRGRARSRPGSRG